ncbi:ABC transporter permease [Schnuerera ultunensis]|uniref:Putative ABC-2 type transport system permease protein n=1 Tax=[Clostridium] ultunense Esp TaxID=1288971 RepID=A0A1M4PJN6_9FIRM|nr:ABC transporter permease [Schnuerera ultunensis]SHD75679.1 putative ABC-2 type transport system permease protein [[Clostridium] ultunense Esp]
MINYIKAELYRNLNRPYYWNFVILISIAGLLLNIITKITAVSDQMSLVEVMTIGIQVINVPIFLVIMMIDMVTSEENKNLTLKNVVSFGIPRNKIIISKIIATAILSIVAALIILTIFLGSGTILFGLGEDFSMDILRDFSLRILAAIPLWISGISVGTFISLVFKNNTIFSFLYAILFTMTGLVTQILSRLLSEKFMYIHKILITTNLMSLRYDVVGKDAMIFAAIVGMGYTILFTILSILYFSRKEVK